MGNCNTTYDNNRFPDWVLPLPLKLVEHVVPTE